MSYQEILDDTIAPAPTSTVDVDRLIGRERRRQQRLRLWSIGGAAATTIAVLALVANGLGARPPVGGVTPSRGYTPPADQAAFDGELANRLTPVLQYRVNVSLPAGVTLRGGYPGDSPMRLFSADRDHYPPRPSPYLAMADILLNGTVGGITVKVGLDVPSWEWTPPPGGIWDLNRVSVGPGFPMDRSCGVLMDDERNSVMGDARIDRERPVFSGCEERTGEHGEHIMSYLTTTTNGGPAWHVCVVKPDGTLVYLHETTRSVLSGPTASPPPLAELVLDRYELTEIALDERLSFWP